MKPEKRLVLFDIDGTLVFHVGTGRNVGFARFQYAIKKVFGFNPTIDEHLNYNGWIDTQICAYIVKPYGITTAMVRKKLPEIEKALHERALFQAAGGVSLYQAIPEAVKLATMLKGLDGVYLGLLTGNVESMAGWKLEHAGIPALFDFGVYGGEADDRIKLAKTVFAKAKKHFGISFTPEKIIVIGDALGDINCAKAIGAQSIIAMTGHHSTRVELLKAGPTLLIDNFMDSKVLTFFGLRK